MARLERKSIIIRTDYESVDWRRDEQEQLEVAAFRAREASSGDAVGELLMWHRADGHATYMVMCEQPLRIAHVDICDGYTVEEALIRGLRLAEVRKMVERERAIRHRFEHANDFYKGLGLGQIVHYHNGGGEFVRCEVALAPDDDACVHVGEGEKCLRELALVGKWHARDLRADGYHMKGVREGHLFHPNASCIYENPEATGARRHPDPRHLAPLALQGQQELFR